VFSRSVVLNKTALRRSGAEVKALSTLGTKAPDQPFGCSEKLPSGAAGSRLRQSASVAQPIIPLPNIAPERAFSPTIAPKDRL
jgi:hypothetical protein